MFIRWIKESNTFQQINKLDHIRTAFVGNLPYQIEEDEVRSVFE